MKFKVYIDGEAGTTGLALRSRLITHPNVTLLPVDQDRRKDPSYRREMMHQADVVFLCLPDDAAREAAVLAEGSDAILIDASTAHRTCDDWVYGLAELSDSHRKAIASSKRIANPGCHATGFITAVYPLVALGILDKDYPLTCHSITGYSGGGKKMIAEYEGTDRDTALDSPRQYGLGLKHKHLKEMCHVPGLAHPPIFNPIVCDFYCGMAVSVPLYMDALHQVETVDQLYTALSEYYKDSPIISVRKDQDGFLPSNTLSGTCKLELHVIGNDQQVTLVSVFDNLGKGASGAAVQNMNIALGLPECTGIV